MIVGARLGGVEDLTVLETMYRELEQEMVLLHSMWPIADGLPEPVESALKQAIDDDDNVVIIGEADGYPFGFLIARVEPLLPQAESERIGSIRFVFVEQEARMIGIGEVMLDLAMKMLREKGLTKFDAHVLPGHRLVKNFFEAGGFSARSIVMHHDDTRE